MCKQTKKKQMLGWSHTRGGCAHINRLVMYKARERIRGGAPRCVEGTVAYSVLGRMDRNSSSMISHLRFKVRTDSIK